MAKARYPYLDLAVLPQLRAYVISAKAAILFSADLNDVLWANGEGAALAGSQAVAPLLEGETAVTPTMLRQIMAAAGRIEDQDSVSAAVRISSGFKSQLVPVTLSRITLPESETAILLLSDDLHGRDHSIDDMARTAANCLDGYGSASAIVDGDGTLIARSAHFDSLETQGQALTDMAREGNMEEDRLVKRPIATGRGALPAGMARVSDTPLLHILVIADDTLSAEPAPVPVSEPAEPQATVNTDTTPSSPTVDAGRVGSFSNRRSVQQGADTGRWYFKPPTTSSEQESEAADAADGEDAVPPEQSNKESNTVGSEGDLMQGGEGHPAEDLVGDEADGFQFEAGAKPVRFVWEMNAGQVFTSVSVEFARTVGIKSAAVVGRAWQDIVLDYGFDNGEEIQTLLEKGDTWSGKTVLWPIEGTDLRVPIDLAGLPSYNRTRQFDGFNGFGIVRTGDAVVDPAATGLLLGDDGPADTNDDLLETGPSNRIGFLAGATRDTEDPDPQPAPHDGNVVDLSQRRNQGNRALSSDDQETFREIADTLKDVSDPVSAPQDVDTHDTVDDDTGGSHDDTPSVETPFIPSAFAPNRRSSGSLLDEFEETEPGTAPPSHDEIDDIPGQDEQTAAHIVTPEHDVDTSILGRLPIPVLVYRQNELLFGNDQFFALTGHASLQDLAREGGVSALFGAERTDDGDSDDSTPVFHRDGTRLAIHAHIQRVPWDDRGAMLLTLRGTEDSRPEVGDMQPVVSDIDPSPDMGIAPPRPLPDQMAMPDTSVRLVRSDYLPTQSVSNQEILGPEDAFGGLDPEDLRNILDTATDGVVIVSEDGTVRAINRSAEALFDEEPANITGRPLTRLLAPESHRIAMDYLAGIAGTSVASVLNDGREVIGRTSHGGLIPLFMTIGKLQNTNACCAVMRDITQWKKAEEDLLTASAQAQRASEQKSEFLAKISHEIRTPLNAIIGFSDLMIEERFGTIESDRYRGYLRDIHKCGNHVLDLINDLLDISKIEAGKVEMDFDACDLNLVVSETVAMSQPDANKQRVIIRTSLSAVVPKVVADPRSLKQIVLNLVSNSIKYTKSGGQVIVSTVYEESGEVVLRVRDTGVGMSTLDLERALRPFEQPNPTQSTSQRGTGLGLPLTKAMVEANRALFHIESEPDEGTLVEIHFPSQRVLADQ